MKNILDHKKPIFWTFWITIILILVLLIVGTTTIVVFNKNNTEINKEIDSSAKGLELYIWRYPNLTGNTDIYFTLLQGTSRNKTEDEIYDLDIATTDLEEINKMLENFEETEVFINIVQRKEGINAEEEVVNLEELNGIVKQIVFPNETQNQKVLTDDEELQRIEEEINIIIDIICSSPLDSSDSNNYIKEHQQEYDEIITYGYRALPSLVKILDARKFDLKENIAYSLCSDILIDCMPFSNIIYTEQILFTQEARRATTEWLDEYSS